MMATQLVTIRAMKGAAGMLKPPPKYLQRVGKTFFGESIKISRSTASSPLRQA
jgi:hypothetical protein